jgi:hypothetical protein
MPATAATLLALGAPNALRAAAAAAAAAAVPLAAGGATEGDVTSDGSDGGPDSEAAWAAAMWASLAAIKLPLDAAASGAGGTGSAPLPAAPSWALDLVSAALSAAHGAARVARALEVMGAVPPVILKLLSRHPGLLRGLCAFVAGCGDAAVVESGLKPVRTLAMLETAACASDETQGGCAAACAGEPGGPGALAAALAELRRWLSMLSRAPDRIVAGEAAAGLAAFDASRGTCAGDSGSGGGGGAGGKGAGAGPGAMASSGGCSSSDEAAESAAASTSQQATAAPSAHPKGKLIRSCAVCGQTEAQLGRAPKACAGCRKVRCAGVLGNE